MKNNHTFVSVISLTWDQAVILDSLGCISRVRIEATSPLYKVLAETVEENSFGQIRLTNLKPGHQHRLVIKWRRGRRNLQSQTLPIPRGRLLSAFVAGDLTNDGTAADYRLLDRALGPLKCPLLAVPGDHDLLGAGARNWAKYLGPKQWRLKHNRFRITGLNTGNYLLGRNNLQLLAKPRNDKRLSLIVSHCQLVPDDYIISDSKCVKDYDQYDRRLKEILQSPSLIYIGHQNVASRITIGKSTQINLPQPVQFPCGYLLVRQYDNGIYHTFMPIRSQALTEYSRMASNRAADHYQEPHWHDHYGLGNDGSAWNFFIKQWT